MEKVLSALLVFLLLFGCLTKEEIEDREAMLSECSKKDFSEIKPRFGNDGFYKIPFVKIENFSFGEWQPIIEFFDSKCGFGRHEWQNKNYLYCYNSVRVVKSDKSGNITDVADIGIELVFKKDNNSFYFINHKCRIYYD